MRRIGWPGPLLALLALGLSAAPVSAQVEVRWLGVAGFSISDGTTTLLHDPYLSRPGLWTLAFSRYRPDETILLPLLAPDGPAPELAQADVVLIGHSHFDHLGDAPWLAARTGAVVVGSETTVHICRGYGLPASQTRRSDPGDGFQAGSFRVRVVESRHANLLFGRPPLLGEVTEPPDGPIHALSFPLGDARNHLVTHTPSGLRLMLSSSANRHQPALEALQEEGVTVDLLLAAPQGRDATLAADLLRTLRPRLVVPHHYESFLTALHDPEATTPRNPEDLAAFEDELRAAAEAEGLELEVRRLGLFERLVLTPRDG